MDIKTAIQYALEGNAILFTGAGFSHGAANLYGEKFMAGKALKDYLAEECGIKNTTSSLKAVADYYIRYHKDASHLIKTLTGLYSVTEILEEQKTVMSVDWKRVYTTNYDEIAEFAARKNKFILKSVTLSSECNNPAAQKVCVHINGCINNLTETTLMNEFKLTDTSYDSEILRGKPWFDFMEKDFLSAKAIIIVGYSLNDDLDISRILAMPSISKKIIFVNRPDMDVIEKNVLEKYAPVYDQGVKGLADFIVEERKSFRPSPLINFQFESFIFEHMRAESPEEADFQTLTSFYSLGEIKDTLFLRNKYGEFKYLSCRKALNVLEDRLYSKKKVFLAVSSLGNGKTVFCHLARHMLNQKDINVYTFSKRLVDFESEIMEICKSGKKSIVIIDDYYKHLEVLRLFSIYGHKNISFLLTSRQSKLATNYRKLINTLEIDEEDIQPLFLYSLVENEPRELAGILIDNSLLPEKLGDDPDEVAEYFKSDCKNQVANIVLDLYKNSSIRTRLTSLIKDTMEEEGCDVQNLCILALCSSVMNLGLSFSEMLSVLNVDYLRLSYRESTILNELFNINEDEIVIQSSIIAKTLLYSIVAPERVVDVLHKVVLESDKLYKNDSKYEELLKAVVSHMNFEPMLKDNPANLRYIVKFYNGIRKTGFCKDNPFYWEQFASVCIEAKDFVSANQCIESAYSAANKIPHFTPFQITTVHGELLLKKLLNDLILSCTEADTDKYLETVTKANSLLLKYYDHPENNHYHIFGCAQNFVTIYSKMKDKMSKKNFQRFTEVFIEIKNKMMIYQQSEESYIYPNIEKWRLNIEKCLDDSKKNLKKKK